MDNAGFNVRDIGVMIPAISKHLKNIFDADLEDLFSQSTLESSNPKLEKLHSYFPKMERDLKKVGVTVQHLWEEYFTENPNFPLLIHTLVCNSVSNMILLMKNRLQTKTLF